MEKKPLGLRGIVFILAGILASVCMFMNWFPIDLDLGAIRLDEVLGKINALTLSRMVKNTEETLGTLAAFLPPEWAQLKRWSSVLCGCAVTTVMLYIAGILLRITGKERYRNIASVASGIGAIVTSAAFYTLVSAVYELTGSGAAKDEAMSIVLKSPCIITFACGVVSVFTIEPVDKVSSMTSGVTCDNLAYFGGECVSAVQKAALSVSEMVVDGFVSFGERCVSAAQRTLWFVTEWFVVITGNIGYLLSDLLGLAIGILIGTIVVELTGFVLVAVVAGILVAGVSAAGCMQIVRFIFIKK